MPRSDVRKTRQQEEEPSLFEIMVTRTYRDFGAVAAVTYFQRFEAPAASVQEPPPEDADRFRLADNECDEPPG